MPTTKTKLKVGDRVKVINFFAGLNLKGRTGTIKAILQSGLPIGVEFDEEIQEGHDLDGKCNCKPQHGRYGREDELILLNRLEGKDNIITRKIKERQTKNLQELGLIDEHNEITEKGEKFIKTFN